MFESNLRNTPVKGLGNYGPPATRGPSPAFVNKVLLKHSHTQLFAMAASPYNSRSEELSQRLYGLRSQKCVLPDLYKSSNPFPQMKT